MSLTPGRTPRKPRSSTKPDPSLSEGDRGELVQDRAAASEQVGAVAPERPPAPSSDVTPTTPPAVPASLLPSFFQILLVLIIGGIFAVAGVGAVRLEHPSYSSTAELLIDQPGAIAYSVDQGIISKLSAIRFKYVGLATSTRVEMVAARDLGVPEYVVSNAISASASLDSLLLDVTARADHPEKAQKIANATAEALINYAAQEQERASIPPEKRFVFELVNQAPPGFKVAPTTRRMGSVGAIAGVLAMATTYVLFKLRAPL